MRTRKECEFVRSELLYGVCVGSCVHAQRLARLQFSLLKFAKFLLETLFLVVMDKECLKDDPVRQGHAFERIY